MKFWKEIDTTMDGIIDGDLTVEVIGVRQQGRLVQGVELRFKRLRPVAGQLSKPIECHADDDKTEDKYFRLYSETCEERDRLARDREILEKEKNTLQFRVENQRATIEWLQNQVKNELPQPQIVDGKDVHQWRVASLLNLGDAIYLRRENAELTQKLSEVSKLARMRL